MQYPHKIRLNKEKASGNLLKEWQHWQFFSLLAKCKLGANLRNKPQTQLKP